MIKLISNFLIIAFFSSLVLTIGCKKDKNKEEDVIIPDEPTSVTDIDGNVYKVVKIGNQYWMAENLRVTHFRNGDPIPTTNPPDKDITLETGPVYQWATLYSDSLLDDYGRIYTREAVNSLKGLAPIGWHIASYNEYITLCDYIGGNPNIGYSGIVYKLMEENCEHWHCPNNDATNEIGWNAFGGGGREGNGWYHLFKTNGFWWTIPTANESPTFTITQNINSGPFNIYISGNCGIHVRCIKD